MRIARPGVRIIPIHGKTPKIHDSAFVAPGCTLIGDIEIGADSSIWYNCVLRADVFTIRIGDNASDVDALAALFTYTEQGDGSA